MTTRRTYTVPEVAEMLGISRSTAYVCVRRGEIPSLKLGGRVVISKDGVRRLPRGEMPPAPAASALRHPPSGAEYRH